jgi:predicted secreted protein
VTAHPSTPPPALLKRALSAIDRILGDESDLRELWDESSGDDWRKAMDDLRRRVGA